MNYIDEHISCNITAKELSAVSGYSFHHFCHLFASITGQSVAAYLRHRRLELASDDILQGDSITEVALTRGYETPSGFAKAFRKRYGMSPTEYKSMKGGFVIMVPEFKKMDSFTAVGYKLPPPEGDFKVIDTGAYWLGKDFSSVSKEDYAKLCVPGCGEVGMWMHPDKVSGELYYFFGPMVEDKGFIPEGMESIEISDAEYAVFPVEKASNPEELNANVRKMWKYIFAEWMDDSGYEFNEKKISFEYYIGDDTFVYVPVIKK
ncbi:MAG: AraC family transcriptional regulator [Dehalobacterium sp.]